MNEIETISIDLNGDQYAMLEKMLLISNARKLAMNQPIKCDDLFREILEDIYSPVEDGWSTFEIMIEESVNKIELLKYLTRYIYPNNEDYFFVQLGKEFICDNKNAFVFNLIL